MTLLAWIARDVDHEFATVVHADTRGRAKVAGHSALFDWDTTLEFKDVRVKRAPEFDGKNPTSRDLFDAGWRIGCGECEARCSNEDEPAPTWTKDGRVFCAACTEGRAKR